MPNNVVVPEMSNPNPGAATATNIPDYGKEVNEETLGDSKPELNQEHKGSMAIGAFAKVYGYQSMAIGQQAGALATRGIAIGHYARVKKAAEAGVALGNSSIVNARRVVALGESSITTNVNGVALGADSRSKRGANVLGYNPEIGSNIADIDAIPGLVKDRYAELLGFIKTAEAELNTAKENLKNFIEKQLNPSIEAANAEAAFVKKMKKAKKDTVDQYTQDERAEYDKLVAARDSTKKALDDKNNEKSSIETEKNNKNLELNILGAEYNNATAAWRSSHGAVSVGDENAGYPRQITDLAAGTEDTGAVNVAQLKKMTLSFVDDNSVTSADQVGKVNLSSQKLAIKGKAGELLTTVSKDAQEITISLDPTLKNSLAGKLDTDLSNLGTTIHVS